MVARSSGPNSGSHRSSEPNIPRQPQSSNPADRNGRDAGIRTRDPLNPIQVRYQTAPRPDRRRAFEQARGAVSNAARLDPLSSALLRFLQEPHDFFQLPDDGLALRKRDWWGGDH